MQNYSWREGDLSLFVIVLQAGIWRLHHEIAELELIKKFPSI